MRIERAGAAQQAEAVGDEVETKVVRRQTPANQVEAFEPLTSDVPTSRAGTVVASDRGQVTGTLGVKQGSTNACGPLSLWLALGQFGRATQDWHQLDDELRPWALGTSPGTLIDGARSHNLQAQLYNHGSFFDLERETEAGRAVLVMTDVGGYDRPNGTMQAGERGDLSSHWMRVTRAWEDSLGRRWVEYENPWGTREVLRFEQFDLLWRDQRLAGVPTGYDRTYLLIDRTTAKPLPTTTADDVLAITSAADGAQTVARGVDALARGNVITGVGRIVGGLLTSAFGSAGTLLALPGEILERTGQTLLETGKRGLEDGGLAAIGGAVSVAAGAVVNAVGTVVKSAGNALGFVGQAIGAMVQGALAGLAKLFG